MSNFSFTPTQNNTSDFTYKYLPEDPNENEALREILEEAINYTKCQTIRISQNHYEYLKEVLRLSEPDNDNQVEFYWGLSTGNFYVRERSHKYFDILFWVEPGSLEETIINKIQGTSPMLSINKGLHLFLDPNHGGIIDNPSLEVASLIIFG